MAASRLPWRYLLGMLFLLAITSPLASAANTVILVNHCPYDMFFWVVPGAGPSNPTPPPADDSAFIQVPGNGGSVIHNMIASAVEDDSGVVLKIRDVPHYAVGHAGILQAEYNLAPWSRPTGSIWWDLSVIDCNEHVPANHPEYCPFLHGGIKMYTNGPEELCKTAECMGPKCENAYMDHGSWLGEPSWNCPIGYDLFFEACTQSVPPMTDDGSSHPIGWEPPLPPYEQPQYDPQSEPWPLYPPPPNFPPGTQCYNPECTCYTTDQPHLWPDYFPPNTPVCPWTPSYPFPK